MPFQSAEERMSELKVSYETQILDLQTTIRGSGEREREQAKMSDDLKENNQLVLDLTKRETGQG
jgi:hypothetical protein